MAPLLPADGHAVPHLNYYEDLAADVAGTADAVLQWFGFDAVMPSGNRPLLLVQRDEDSYRMATRFRAEQRQKGQHDGRS